MFRRVLLSTSAVMMPGAVLALALYASPSIASAQRQRPLPDASTAGMVVFFELACATCHESTDPDNRAPSRETLRLMDPERVLQALTAGPMAEFVPNFDDERLRAMAGAGER